MDTTTPTGPQCRYAVDQAVEVYVTDFDTPGFPMVWMRGTVVKVEQVSERPVIWDVWVQRERSTAGSFNTYCRVGPRGGGRRIRAAQ